VSALAFGIAKFGRGNLHEKGNYMKKPRAFSSILTVGLVAFALIGPATTAAHANLQQLCNYDNQCWVNQGPNQYITTSSTGTGWAEEQAGTWNGHPAVIIVAGNGTCATDNGTGSYLGTTDTKCGTNNPPAEQLFYFDQTSGALVSLWPTGQLGRYECLTVLSNGLIGNFACPSGPLPPPGHWVFDD
jgi:hypothetical protein